MMWNRVTAALSAAATFSTFATADPISNCIANDVCFQVGVPTTSASSNKGDIYYQMRASTQYSWVAIGQGEQMAGSNIFVMYPDGRGNVTVSPRAGRGHSMPQFDNSVQVRLLAGSGISSDGQTMVANFVCSNCQKWSGGEMSLASTNANYIGAYLAGSPPSNGASTSASIAQHDNHASWQFDLTKATISKNENPYVSGSGTGGGNGNGGGNGGGGSGNGGGNGGDNVSSGPSSGSSDGVTQVQSGQSTQRLILTHGIIMTIVMVVLYPLGAILMPLIGGWIIHGGVQIIVFLLMWAGFGIGYIASRSTVGFGATHTLFGTVIVALFGIQPFLGVWHHMYYRKHQQRGVVSHVHVWYGRILMVLGVINGGLGLQLAGSGDSFVIAYSVIAVVMFVAYAAAKALGTMRKRKAAGAGAGSDAEILGRSKEQAEHVSPNGSVSR